MIDIEYWSRRVSSLEEWGWEVSWRRVSHSDAEASMPRGIRPLILHAATCWCGRRRGGGVSVRNGWHNLNGEAKNNLLINSPYL